MVKLLQKMPQYRELIIKNKAALKLWLNQTTSNVITFMDKGQEVRTILIDQFGEILHSNLQAALWCGFYVNIEALVTGRNIEIWDNAYQKWMVMYRHIIKKIIHTTHINTTE